MSQLPKIPEGFHRTIVGSLRTWMHGRKFRVYTWFRQSTTLTEMESNGWVQAPYAIFLLILAGRYYQLLPGCPEIKFGFTHSTEWVPL